MRSHATQVAALSQVKKEQEEEEEEEEEEEKFFSERNPCSKEEGRFAATTRLCLSTSVDYTKLLCFSKVSLIRNILQSGTDARHKVHQSGINKMRTMRAYVFACVCEDK